MMKNYGHGLCSCCGGTGRPLYGTDEDVTHRRYCSPCWNTMGVAPTADYPFDEKYAGYTDHPASVIGRGWKRLNTGT